MGVISMETGQNALGEWGRVERVEVKGHNVIINHFVITFSITNQQLTT